MKTKTCELYAHAWGLVDLEIECKNDFDMVPRHEKLAITRMICLILGGLKLTVGRRMSGRGRGAVNKSTVEVGKRH